MANGILDINSYPKWLLHPAWWAVTNLLVSLYGVLFLHWSLEPLIFMFWIEVILSIAAALIRALGAMSGRPFMETFVQKLVSVFFGAIMGIGFIMLTVAFTIKGWGEHLEASGFQNIRFQVYILEANYAAAIILHFFMNGRYKQATPIGELMITFVRLLIILSPLMVITQHLLPKFPQMNTAVWTAITILALKFGADLIFSNKIFAEIEQQFSKAE